MAGEILRLVLVDDDDIDVAERSPASSGANGATDSTTRAPPARAARAAAKTWSCGTSIWRRSVSRGANPPAGICPAFAAALAPGETTMVFSPLSSTVMMATPVVPFRRATAVRSTPAGDELVERDLADVVVADRPDEADLRPGAPRGERLVRALAAGDQRVVGADARSRRAAAIFRTRQTRSTLIEPKTVIMGTVTVR